MNAAKNAEIVQSLEFKPQPEGFTAVITLESLSNTIIDKPDILTSLSPLQQKALPALAAWTAIKEQENVDSQLQNSNTIKERIVTKFERVMNPPVSAMGTSNEVICQITKKQFETALETVSTLPDTQLKNLASAHDRYRAIVERHPKKR